MFRVLGAVLLWAGTIGLLFQQIADKQWKLYPERYIAQHRGESGSVQSDSELIPLNDNHYEPVLTLRMHKSRTSD